MLAESIIRIGRPIKNGKMSCREKLKLLTDCGNITCKNFFRNVFLLEIGENELHFRQMELGNVVKTDRQKDVFEVSTKESMAFPIFYPNGGNPLHAQGIYALPCYLLYDQHIKVLDDPAEFKKHFLLPRLKSTLHYSEWSAIKRERLADRVADLLADKATAWIHKEKQLGILMMYDATLPVFAQREEHDGNHDDLLFIGESGLHPGRYLYLDGGEALQHIGRAKFYEAAELGREQQAVSTFTNRTEPEVVSIYNKSWLWLSPTWECPRSIYWADDEWTKGIKLDEESYVAYVYGVNFLKEIQVPVSSSILKEMFAPVTSVEAKKNMKATSFEAIYGIPLVLPLLNGDSQQLFTNYRRMLKKENEKQSDSDLQLKLLAGLDGILPAFSDEHRLTILYYSGDLSRGNMHIRAMIEDVIPSVAGRIEMILKELICLRTGEIQNAFGIQSTDVYRAQTLPALIANAFGPGYVWKTLQAVFHKESFRLDRLRLTTVCRLNELANREEHWQMMQELVFFYCFLFFWQQYEKRIVGREGGVHTLADWKEFQALYGQGQLESSHLKAVEPLGFVAGLLLRQFSNSYHHKTGKEFVKNRVMKFGSKLTPDMIWRDGLLRCEELAQQWSMNLAANFRPMLAVALLSFLENQAQLVVERDIFMTAFWSGYLLYKADKTQDKIGENGGNEAHEQQ